MFAQYGERGSVDVLGLKEIERVAVLIEVKSELATWEETLRRLDVKLRLLPQIMAARFGWRPRTIAVAPVLEASMTNRRRVDALGEAARQHFPARTVAVKGWLRAPSGSLRGIWFVSPGRGRTVGRSGGGAHRIRRSLRG